MEITLDQQYNVGEKSTGILYSCASFHDVDEDLAWVGHTPACRVNGKTFVDYKKKKKNFVVDLKYQVCIICSIIITCKVSINRVRLPILLVVS